MNPYEILGIPRNADEALIKKAYRHLASRWHPDKPDGDSDTFKKVTQAFKSAMERVGEASVETRMVPGEDMSIELTLTLEESVLGCVKKVVVPNWSVVCPLCEGTGKNPNAAPAPCPSCLGRGTTFDPVSVVMTCKMCMGSGFARLMSCDECKGLGKTDRDIEIIVKMPSGVKPGDEIRFPQQGLPGINMPPGDLYVRVKQKRHRRFSRNGDDLIIEKSLSLAEVLTGTEFKLDVPGHGETSVTVPAMPRLDRDVVVEGAGVKNVRTGVRGSLRVKVRVRMPSKLTPRARRLVDELVNELNRSGQR